MTTNYPARRSELQGLMLRLGRELPGPLGGFANLHKAATAGGALDAKTKELIALGIAVAVHCELLPRVSRSGCAQGRRDARGGVGSARGSGDDGRRARDHVCLRRLLSAGAVRERAQVKLVAKH